ncbi:MAG: type II secretion system protein [Acidobacteriota bacterium]
MRDEPGFSLIELLVVMAIIGLIAALAVPNLKRARQQALSSSAIQSMRTITTAEALYERKYRRYAVLFDLSPEGTLDSHLKLGVKSHYKFSITLAADQVHYTVTATPILDPAEMNHYFTDQSAVIRFNLGAPADATSDPIPAK